MKTLGFLIFVSTCFSAFAQKENEEIFFEQKVIVYPNPTSESFKVITDDLNEKTIVVADYSGKTVFQATTTDKNFDILCNDWFSGVYLITLFQTSGNSQYKVMKQ
jgi:hypothetical protein